MAFNLNECFYPLANCETEKDVIIVARRHWISFLGNIIIAIFLFCTPIIVLILAQIFSPNILTGKFLNILVIAGSVYYLLITNFIFSAWISYYYDIYILTSEIMVDVTQKGFFNRKTAQLSLMRVQDVSAKIDGVFPTMFSYGDVLVETAGEHVENFLLKAVPNPQQFASKVMEAHDQLISREGRSDQLLSGEGTIIPEPKKEEIIKPLKPQIEQDQHQAGPPRAEGEISNDDLGKGGEVKF